MFQNPTRAKRLYFDVIPKMTDEYLKLRKDFEDLDVDEKYKSPIWFLNNEKEFNILENFSFSMILNLANVCNAESSEILWGFIENYYPGIDRRKFPLIQKLLEYGVEYYKKFVFPRKKYRSPNDLERKGFIKLIQTLESLDNDSEAEDIQTKVYEIGMELKFSNLKDWFSGFYQVILGQEQGPRLGSFIKFYGLKKTIELLKEKVN